jgi:hypothetical protein
VWPVGEGDCYIVAYRALLTLTPIRSADKLKHMMVTKLLFISSNLQPVTKSLVSVSVSMSSIDKFCCMALRVVASGSHGRDVDLHRRVS